LQSSVALLEEARIINPVRFWEVPKKTKITTG
jgi:hypothetical protein